MNWEESSGPALVPEYAPSESDYARWQRNTERLSEEEVRLIFWTQAIARAFWEEGVAARFPSFRYATAGFTDPDVEGDHFAVIVYRHATVPTPATATLEPVHYLRFPNWRVPIFDRSIVEIPHQSVHPANGTTTAWASSHKAQLQGQLMVLTAKHVLDQRGLGYTNLVPLVDQSGQQHVGHVADIAPDGVDAALIRPPRSVRPRNVRSISTKQLIAQWTDVEVRGTRSQFRTKIIEVELGRGSMDPSIPLRLFLAQPGRPGDSGALVVDDSGSGVGLYMSGVVNLAGGVEGCCQHLGQVCHALNIDLSTES